MLALLSLGIQLLLHGLPLTLRHRLPVNLLSINLLLFFLLSLGLLLFLFRLGFLIDLGGILVFWLDNFRLVCEFIGHLEIPISFFEVILEVAPVVTTIGSTAMDNDCLELVIDDIWVDQLSVRLFTVAQVFAHIELERELESVIDLHSVERRHIELVSIKANLEYGWQARNFLALVDGALGIAGFTVVVFHLFIREELFNSLTQIAISFDLAWDV